MPKNTKRTKVKDLPRAKKELTTKAAKKVKGGQGTLVAPVTRIKIGGITKGSYDLGQLPGGLQ